MFTPVFIVLAAVAVAGMSQKICNAGLYNQLTRFLVLEVHGKGSVANCDREYVVQSGDFCNKISASQGVST